MKSLLAVGAGSMIGGVLRYLISESVRTKFLTTFPIGTLTVNISGCFFIGLVIGFAERGSMSGDWRLFLATGLLGGFTTFSAFSYETFSLMREGQNLYAITYIGASVCLGLLATFAGYLLLRLF